MNIDDDDRLPDLFGDNKNMSIEDLVKADEADQEAEDDILNDERRADRKKTVLLGVAGLLVVCGLATGFFFMNPFGKDDNKGFDKGGDNGSSVVQTSDGGSENTSANKDVKDDDVDESELFYKEKGKYFPVKLDKWQEKEYKKSSSKDSDTSNNSDSDKLSEDILKTYAGTDLGNASSVLPSEESGYTSDDSKAELEDGSLNPYYSYWTAEEFEKEAGTAIERLLNPTFGGWGTIQYASYPGNKYYNPNTLGDLFTDNWQTKNAGKEYSSYVPIYADWNGDNYGGNDELLDAGPRWYGNVESSDMEFNYDDETQQYTVNYTADVNFTAWAKDQSKLEKKGTLTIKFVANSDNQGDPSHKVLIDDASLKVDE